MIKKTTLSAFALFLTACACVPAMCKAASGPTQSRYDFKLYGGRNHWQGKKERVMLFYLSNKTKRLGNGDILIWSETLDAKAVANVKLTKSEVAALVARFPSYHPPIERLQPLSQRQWAAVITAEYVADAHDVLPITASHLEIDCHNRKFKLLGHWFVTPATGKTDYRDVSNSTETWSPFPQDSLIGNLAFLLCPTPTSTK